MRIYAERPTRAARQLLADLLVVAWVVLCVLVANIAEDMVGQLQRPALALGNAGTAIRNAFENAATTAAGVPFVGEDLARALGAGTSAGESVASAGHQQAEAVGVAATVIGFGILALGALPVVLVWLTLRVRWVRAARSAQAAREHDSELLALRALTRLPVQRLLAVAPDPSAAWRRADTAVIGRLAALELGSLGLRPPKVAEPDTVEVGVTPPR